MGNAYFGSKATAGLCQALIALMPPHSVYIESHLGGGAIMKRKPPALLNIGVELVHGCCHRYLSEFAFDGTELVYADPPYLKSTRKAPSRYRYRYDYEQQDHVRLLGLLRKLPCQVMISGYSSPLYDELVGDWKSFSVQVMNQAGVVTEKVWFNFEPDQVHWSRYAGRDFTERQRIKRKAQSWSRRYGQMRAPERLAVLSAILAVEAE